jgi:phosphate transport system substrate-binding protein
MKTAFKYGLLAWALGLLWSCSGGNESGNPDEANRVSVAVDQSLQPVMEAEEMAFEATHKYSKVDSKYVTELKAIEMLLNDSARVAIVTREMNPQERKILAEQKYRYRSVKIAIDAVALITSQSNPDTLITTDELRDVLSGKRTTWNQVGKNGGTGKITVVFDNNSSSNLSYLLDTLGVRDRSKAPIYAVRSNEEVIGFVKKNPGAMGVIGVNWISDVDDPKTPKFMEGIRVMAVARNPDPDPEDYYQPFQYNLALNHYPLSRKVVMISKDARQGAATSYINYVASDRGQRIVLKAGLLPATQIIRLVNTHPE